MRKFFFLSAAPLLAIFLVLSSCKSSPTEEPPPPPPPPGSSDCQITSFSIKNSANPSLGTNLTFTIDQQAKTIDAFTIKWITGNDNFEFIPEFSTSGKEVKVGNTVQESGKTKNSFIDPLEYTVVAEDGSTNTYIVKFFSPQFNSSVPVIRIKEPDSRIGDNYIKSAVEIIPNGWPGDLWDYSKKEVEIRLRGNSTRHLPKRPYRMKFDSKISPLGLTHAKEKNWVLIANDCDKTLLRNAVSFEMSRILHANPSSLHDSRYVIPFTPSFIHVNVFMDDEYRGLYQFSDHMQRKDGRIAVEELVEGSADETGGYVIEVDIHAGSGDVWFNSLNNGKITMKYPDGDDYTGGEQGSVFLSRVRYIEDHLRNKAEAALYGANFRSEWRNYFDEATAVDYLIVNEFSGDPDAYTSIYLYKRKGNDKFYFGPVWDFDSAYDNDNRVQNAQRNLMIDRSFKHGGYENKDHWIQQMWKDEDFRRTVKVRWNAMKAQLLSGALKRIDDDIALLGASIDANYTRWDIKTQALDTAMPSPSSYEAGITALKKYINDRYKYLDEVFNQVN